MRPPAGAMTARGLPDGSSIWHPRTPLRLPAPSRLAATVSPSTPSTMAKGSRPPFDPSMYFLNVLLSSSPEFPSSRRAREGREGHRRRLVLLWSRGWGRYHDEPLERHHNWSRTCTCSNMPPCGQSMGPFLIKHPFIRIVRPSMRTASIA